MKDYACKALDLTEGLARDDLDRNETLRLALTHLVELVGEAANQVPPDRRAAWANIPWAKVVAMRHRLIHGYDLVDYDILWDTIRHDFPALIAELDRILTPRP